MELILAIIGLMFCVLGFILVFMDNQCWLLLTVIGAILTLLSVGF